MVYWIVLLTLLLGSQPGGAATVGPSTALAAFDRGEYDRVLSIVATSPPDQKLPRALLRAVVLSYAPLGRAEEGLPSYDTLSAAGDDRAVLRELAKSLVVAHVRDAAEHVRITAYMALGDVGEASDLPVLQDGLLDGSPMVRSRAVDALGRLSRGGRP
ncbi:MAG TPA: HEAT repeat domain-containing protein, partial [Nitrospirales bacterium]|nr:HEAT repeat domain-containing protein [Nitrospirales bacterium]